MMGYLFSLQPTFAQGLVIGQLSVLLLLALIFKYLFLVSDPSTSQHIPTTPTTPRSRSKQAVPCEGVSESTEWLNVIISEIVETYRAELRNNHAGPEGDESTRSKMEMRLNSLRPEGFVDPILVHSVDLGSLAPQLSNARINPTQISPKSPEIEFDMTYTDTASISLSTSVLFNYPFYYFARLPVSLTLSLSLFSSKIVLTLPCPTSTSPTMTFALAPSFTLDLHISSLLGSRAKLVDVPKLHDMIESHVKKTLASRGSWTIVLPGISRPKDALNAHFASDEIGVKLENDDLGRPPDLTALKI